MDLEKIQVITKVVVVVVQVGRVQMLPVLRILVDQEEVVLQLLFHQHLLQEVVEVVVEIKDQLLVVEELVVEELEEILVEVKQQEQIIQVVAVVEKDLLLLLVLTAVQV